MVHRMRIWFHDVGEYGAFLEDEGFSPVRLLQDGGARDVSGQQVRSELHTPCRNVQRLGKPLDQFRFAQSGQALQQDMAAGQHAGEDKFNEIFLAEQNLVHGGGQGVKLLHGSAELFRGEREVGIHGELPDGPGFLKERQGELLEFWIILCHSPRRSASRKRAGPFNFQEYGGRAPFRSW